MKHYPNEILLNIFQHLSIYSQHQCLQVCKSWNAVARTFTTDTTQKLEIRSHNDVGRFTREVIANPARGLAIRQIHFNESFPGDDRITKGEFINLINACPHLAEILLTDTHPVYRCGYLCEDDVRLPQLEAIHLRRWGFQDWRGPKYINLMYRYRATINQMCVDVIELEISRFGLNSTAEYLHQFPCLKYLSLEASSCAIVFDAIIQACPQLQVLMLRMRPYSSFKILADERDNSMSALTPASQLETLKVKETLIPQQLFQYLKHCCTFLSHLVITLSFDADFDSLISTFAAFENAQSLPIRRISFENYSHYANPLMPNLFRWFPHLNQVDLKGYGPTPGQECPRTVLLDFDQLNLLHVSIDLSAFFVYRSSSWETIALELITDNATTWYERPEKLTSRKQFIRKDNVQYTNVTARERRIQSENTVVISVKAANIQSIRILFTSFERFNQLIQLDQ